MSAKPYSRYGTLSAKLPLVAPGQRVGLLGGSFNPPHAAHALISQIALRRLGLDRVWWMVTPGNPLKAGQASMSLAERVAACRAMAQDRRIEVTTFEAQLPTAFTAATLDYLRLRAPDTAFVWLMGADCLAEFHRWRQWQHIFETLPVAVIDRPGWRLQALAAPAARRFQASRWPEARAADLATAKAPAWTLLSGPLSPLSSTQVREHSGAGARAVGEMRLQGSAKDPGKVLVTTMAKT